MVRLSAYQNKPGDSMRVFQLLALSVLSLASVVTAQEQPPAAKPADVQSVDAIIEALYDVISGAAGQQRDWDRFRSLFLPGGRLISAGVDQEGQPRHTLMTPEDYVARSGPFLERNGFFENEIHRVTEAFGNILHLFSTYESRRTPEEQPFTRGINSIQLYNDGSRWWVVSILWDSERAGNPIPAKYLPK